MMHGLVEERLLAALFGDPAASQPTGGPCLFDPAPGALFLLAWGLTRTRSGVVGR